jgi:hypothetical protein
MAYTQVSLDHHDENMVIVNRLEKVNKPFIYGENISLAHVRNACTEEKRLIEEKNALLKQADALGIQIAIAVKKTDTYMSNLRNSIGMDYGRNSDEFGFADGVLLADIIEKSKMTRENNKRNGDDKK